MTHVDSDIGYTGWPDTPEENARMARRIVGSGGRLYAQALLETHTDANDGRRRCHQCARVHPCQTRRCAERAIQLLDEQDRRHLGQRHRQVER